MSSGISSTFWIVGRWRTFFESRVFTRLFAKFEYFGGMSSTSLLMMLLMISWLAHVQVLSLEGLAPHEELEQHAARVPHVAPEVVLHALADFGRQIEGRADGSGREFFGFF